MKGGIKVGQRPSCVPHKEQSEQQSTLDSPARERSSSFSSPRLCRRLSFIVCYSPINQPCAATLVFSCFPWRAFYSDVTLLFESLFLYLPSTNPGSFLFWEKTLRIPHVNFHLNQKAFSIDPFILFWTFLSIIIFLRII